MRKFLIVVICLILPLLASAQDFKQRDFLFSDNVDFGNASILVDHDKQNARLGVQMFYCADIADRLNKPFEAKKLYEKGAIYLDKYVESLAKFSLDYSLPDGVVDFYKPRYVGDKNLLKGMILQDTLNKAMSDIPQTYSLSSDVKNELKIFYTEKCTEFL